MYANICVNLTSMKQFGCGRSEHKLAGVQWIVKSICCLNFVNILTSFTNISLLVLFRQCRPMQQCSEMDQLYRRVVRD